MHRIDHFWLPMLITALPVFPGKGERKTVKLRQTDHLPEQLLAEGLHGCCRQAGQDKNPLALIFDEAEVTVEAARLSIMPNYTAVRHGIIL